MELCLSRPTIVALEFLHTSKKIFAKTFVPPDV